MPILIQPGKWYVDLQALPMLLWLANRKKPLAPFNLQKGIAYTVVAIPRSLHVVFL